MFMKRRWQTVPQAKHVWNWPRHLLLISVLVFCFWDHILAFVFIVILCMWDIVWQSAWHPSLCWWTLGIIFLHSQNIFSLFKPTVIRSKKKSWFCACNLISKRQHAGHNSLFLSWYLFHSGKECLELCQGVQARVHEQTLQKHLTQSKDGL